VRAFAKVRTTTLLLPLVKRIALHLLRGIAHTHEGGIVHTDFKLDNILFPTVVLQTTPKYGWRRRSRMTAWCKLRSRNLYP